MAVDLPDLLLVIIGGGLTLIGVFVQSWITQNQFQKQLANPAMKQLFALITDRKTEPLEWSERIIKFLKTFEASFIPIRIQTKALNLVYEMDDRYAKAYPDKRQKLTDEDTDKIIKDYEKEYAECPKKRKLRLISAAGSCRIK